MITLVLGGVRSGKSELAERLAARGDTVTYVATAPADPTLADRIARHRERRPNTWVTVEASGDATAAAIRAVTAGVVLLDSLGSWLASDPDLAPDVDALIEAMSMCEADIVVVTEEVGLSVHPPTEVGRRFQDGLGSLNRRVAAISDRVLLVVAGRVTELGPSIEELE